MVNLSRFKQPGSYVRFFHAKRETTVYYYLIDREGPKIYPYVFAELAAGVKQTTTTNIKEINPSDQHIAQTLIGFYPGAKFFIWHQKDKKILSWDESIESIPEDDTAYLDHTMSSPEDPMFALWLEHDKYPGFQPKNTFQRQATFPKIEIHAMVFTFEEVTDANELEKLRKRIIRSEPILLGRGALVI